MAQTRGRLATFGDTDEFRHHEEGSTGDTLTTLTGHKYHRLDSWCPLSREHCRDDCAWYDHEKKECKMAEARLLEVI